MDRAEYKRFIAHLPNTPGILNRNRFFHSVVLVPFIYSNGEYSLLFQKRAAAIRQGGEVSFPGGGFDPQLDRGIQETALRETVEELGIEAEKIKIEKRFHSLVSLSGALVDIFLGQLDIKSLEELNPNPQEVEELFLIPVNHFQEHPATEYKIRVEIHSRYLDPDTGKEIVLFPARELGIPEKYHNKWNTRFHSVISYQTQWGTIWGLTAEIIQGILEYI